MPRLFFTLSLILLLSHPAAAEDTSCKVSGGIVGIVRKGDATILMSCPDPLGTNPFPCTCHAPTDDPEKCRVYACNGKGEPGEDIPASAPAKPSKAELKKQAAEAARQARLKKEEERKQVQEAAKQKKLKEEQARQDAIEAVKAAKAKKEEERIQAIEAAKQAEIQKAAAEKQAAADAAQLKSIQEKAYANDMQAELDLGYIYMRGNGVKPQIGIIPDDEKYAGEWRMTPAPPPGVMLDQDYGQAFHWYRNAANQGNFEAQYNLGLMYLYGRGVHQDKVEAYYWFSLAAKTGSGIQQANNEAFLNNSGLSAEQIESVNERIKDWKPEQPPLH